VGVYETIITAKRAKKALFAVLVDPGKTDVSQLNKLLKAIEKRPVDFIFIGGSLASAHQLDQCIQILKDYQTAPIVIFPGNEVQIHPQADAILLLSLISGRNPDLLIGKHVNAALQLKKSKLEVIPTGYMLIESGRLTSVAYMSHTLPIPRDKNDIASATALAGELLGMKLIYLEAGSGAEQPVPAEMIKEVKEVLNIPLIVGGGIDNAEKYQEALKAGADLIVVGNALAYRTRNSQTSAQGLA
jgi:putative glycerol-1-phosphate prenyltransferase